MLKAWYPTGSLVSSMPVADFLDRPD